MVCNFIFILFLMLTFKFKNRRIYCLDVDKNINLSPFCFFKTTLISRWSVVACVVVEGLQPLFYQGALLVLLSISFCARLHSNRPPSAKSGRLEQRNKSVLFSQWTSPRRTQGYRVVRAALSTKAPEHLAPRNEVKHGLRVR